MQKLFFSCCLFLAIHIQAQIVSGPMLGHTELRTSTIWFEVSDTVNKYQLSCWDVNNFRRSMQILRAAPVTQHGFSKLVFSIGNLIPGTQYKYQLSLVGVAKTLASGDFKTQELWQWRKDPPKFSFLTGSCVYINQPEFDRPGKPYGNDSSIFETMAKEKADFMLWLGDNWYTREVDYYSEWGLYNRPSFERKKPLYKNFLQAMPHYAIWDDHDYGWNDGDKSYPFKETSRSVFQHFWANPSYGQNNQAIYSKFTWNDIDIFLLDDRWFRSNDDMPDSINGKVNTNKEMFGKQQLEWLKNALLQSKNNRNISFRIIATGSQILNPVSPYDCFKKFSAEYEDFMNFIQENSINGLLFFTGDRHHSEVIKVERKGAYALYDITSSPLTSGSHKFGGPEKNNAFRVAGVDNVQNYSRVTVEGALNNRALKVEYVDGKGNVLTSWSIGAKELK